MSVSLTERAAEEVKTIIEQQDLAGDIYLRMGVKGGGCSGFSYALVHGVKVICDPKSFLYLSGVTVDFKDEVMGRGFVFNNPNASGTCGCGSSFTV
jgi:iron-sulfur cluster assembly protein